MVETARMGVRDTRPRTYGIVLYAKQYASDLEKRFFQIVVKNIFQKKKKLEFDGRI